MVAKIVAYYRVSTERQGRSGLGLEGQLAAVEGYANGIGAKIVRSYREVESGKRADRPELLKAIADAKRSKATLVIAKFDRLSRNVAFLANLLESGVEFVACDNPHANRLTIHILAAVAEGEAKMISERTKAALAAYKARGGVLGAERPDGRQLSPEASARPVSSTGPGNWNKRLYDEIFCGYGAGNEPICPGFLRNRAYNGPYTLSYYVLTIAIDSDGNRRFPGVFHPIPVSWSNATHAPAKGREMASASIRARAAVAYSDLLPFVRQLRGEGQSLQSIADVLNSEGHVTRRGKPWNKVQVARVLDRVGD